MRADEAYEFILECKQDSGHLEKALDDLKETAEHINVISRDYKDDEGEQNLHQSECLPSHSVFPSLSVYNYSSITLNDILRNAAPLSFRHIFSLMSFRVFTFGPMTTYAIHFHLCDVIKDCFIMRNIWLIG
jgi:hypothetical protein